MYDQIHKSINIRRDKSQSRRHTATVSWLFRFVNLLENSKAVWDMHAQSFLRHATLHATY